MSGDSIATRARAMATDWPRLAPTRGLAAGLCLAWAYTALDDARSMPDNPQGVATFVRLARVYWRAYRYIGAEVTP